VIGSEEEKRHGAKQKLAPARELAAKNGARFPNESDAYRVARNALLAEEIELHRHIERVAELRRQRPPGGEVTEDYCFGGEAGLVNFADLFGTKNTLVAYSYMYGPQRERPCPMCTSLMSAWDGEARDIEQRVAFAMIARSPIERLKAFKKERGWRNLKLYSDTDGNYTRDYVSAEDADMPAFNVFTPGTVRSAIFGAARWERSPLIRARTRAAPPISCRSGPFSMRHPKGAEATGIQNWSTGSDSTAHDTEAKIHILDGRPGGHGAQIGPRLHSVLRYCKGGARSRSGRHARCRANESVVVGSSGE